MTRTRDSYSQLAKRLRPTVSIQRRKRGTEQRQR